MEYLTGRRYRIRTSYEMLTLYRMNFINTLSSRLLGYNYVQMMLESNMEDLSTDLSETKDA